MSNSEHFQCSLTVNKEYSAINRTAVEEIQIVVYLYKYKLFISHTFPWKMTDFIHTAYRRHKNHLYPQAEEYLPPAGKIHGAQSYAIYAKLPLHLN